MNGPDHRDTLGASTDVRTKAQEALTALAKRCGDEKRDPTDREVDKILRPFGQKPLGFPPPSQTASLRMTFGTEALNALHPERISPTGFQTDRTPTLEAYDVKRRLTAKEFPPSDNF